jgi:hypothetical protein
MVVQVVANWQIDPLIGRDHRWTIDNRVLHDVELICWTDAACASQSSLIDGAKETYSERVPLLSRKYLLTGRRDQS